MIGRESTTEKGRAAEERAARWMIERGWRILERNFRTASGEIDLIAEDPVSRTLVVAEVRSRTSGPVWVQPLESVDVQKQRTIEKVARVYLARYRGNAQALRFDVFTWDGKQLGWVERAWG